MIPQGFRGEAKRLDAIDIPRLGRAIGVGEDEVRAILEVESRGAGFDKQGRPVLLFEPHLFWRILGPGKARDRAARDGLAYPKWKAGSYPRDSYPRLVKAMEIDETAALKACSWGLGQVLGDNHRKAGFASVQEMVEAHCADEENHLAAMVGFIKAAGLDDEIRRHDWAGFARGYNGPGYAKHNYHGRLAAAHAKWATIPDLPFDIGAAAEEDERIAAPAETFADKARVKAVQERLIALGYHMVGRPDGVMGPRTAGAIAAFEAENGFPVTGKIDQVLIDRLETAEPHEPSPERQAGTPPDSSILKSAKELIVAGGAVVTGGVVNEADKALGQAEQAIGLWQRVRAVLGPFREMLGEALPYLLLAGGVYLVWRGGTVYWARLQDYRKGKTA